MSNQSKRAIGAILGAFIAIIMIRTSGSGLVFLRDALLAAALFTYLGIRLWRRAVAIESIGPICDWHLGQLILVLIAGIVLITVCTKGLDPLARAFGSDVFERSSIPRLILLAILYPIVAGPPFLFWIVWTWFGRGRRRVAQP